MSNERISRIALDDGGIKHRSVEAEHERMVAITDLMHENTFEPVGLASGPYDVLLRIEEGRLVFDIRPMEGEQKTKVSLSVQPLRSIIRDYFLICESYYEALKAASTGKIEAIDMGRRGVHNEGSELLEGLLKDKIRVDFATARRLFTLICVLHIK
jgi:uncharacterized protein (UPF0262 family)